MISVFIFFPISFHYYSESFHAFVFHEDAIFLDLIDNMPTDTWQSIAGTLVCMTAVCFLFLRNTLTVIIAAASVLSVSIGWSILFVNKRKCYGIVHNYSLNWTFMNIFNAYLITMHVKDQRSLMNASVCKVIWKNLGSLII